MTTTVQQTLFTQAFINHSSFAPIAVPATPFTERIDQPGYLDPAKAIELLKEAWVKRVCCTVVVMLLFLNQKKKRGRSPSGMLLWL